MKTQGAFPTIFSVALSLTPKKTLCCHLDSNLWPLLRNSIVSPNGERETLYSRPPCLESHRSVKQLMQCPCMLGHPGQDDAHHKKYPRHFGVPWTDLLWFELLFRSLLCFLRLLQESSPKSVEPEAILSCFDNRLQSKFRIESDNHVWISRLLQIIQKTL